MLLLGASRATNAESIAFGLNRLLYVRSLRHLQTNMLDVLLLFSRSCSTTTLRCTSIRGRGQSSALFVVDFILICYRSPQTHNKRQRRCWEENTCTALSTAIWVETGLLRQLLLSCDRAYGSLCCAVYAGMRHDLIFMVSHSGLGDGADVASTGLEHIRVVWGQHRSRSANDRAQCIVHLFRLWLVHSRLEDRAFGGSIISGRHGRMRVQIVVVVCGRAYNRALPQHQRRNRRSCRAASLPFVRPCSGPLTDDSAGGRRW